MGRRREGAESRCAAGASAGRLARVAVMLTALTVAACSFPKAPDTPPEPTEEDAKASFAADHPFVSTAATSQNQSGGNFLPSDCPTDDSQVGPRDGATAAGVNFRVEACRDQSKRLQDQLDAFCADGQQDACKLRDFAIKKRACCTWHYGVRGCSRGGEADGTVNGREAHRVTCFDNTVAIGPACGC